MFISENFAVSNIMTMDIIRKAINKKIITFEECNDDDSCTAARIDETWFYFPAGQNIKYDDYSRKTTEEKTQDIFSVLRTMESADKCGIYDTEYKYYICTIMERL